MDHLVPFETLLGRMRAGDAAATEEFYARYEPFLRRVARRWLTPPLRRHADSGDVVQSVFRIAFGGLPGTVFENERKMLAWLATVTRHRVSRLARRVRGPGGAAIEDVDGAEPAAAAADSPAALAEKAEAVHRLKATLDRLPADEREAVLLRDFEGLAFAEVAERLRRPTADAAQHLHARARKRLAGWLDVAAPVASPRRST